MPLVPFPAVLGKAEFGAVGAAYPDFFDEVLTAVKGLAWRTE